MLWQTLAGPTDEVLCFAQRHNHLARLSGNRSSASILELMVDAKNVSADALARAWQRDVPLVARLLDVANGVSLRRSGRSVDTLRDAIGVMGVDHALKQALALSLDVGRSLDHSALTCKAREYHELSLAIADRAGSVAAALKMNPQQIYIAGLLSRVGELAVLDVLQSYVNQGGELSESELEQCLRDWAQKYGNRLKVSWKLPLEIRELSGAAHFLPQGVTNRGKLVMRLAAILVAGQEDSEECRKLKRLVGWEEDSGGGDGE